MPSRCCAPEGAASDDLKLQRRKLRAGSLDWRKKCAARLRAERQVAGTAISGGRARRFEDLHAHAALAGPAAGAGRGRIRHAAQSGPVSLQPGQSQQRLHRCTDLRDRRCHDQPEQSELLALLGAVQSADAGRSIPHGRALHLHQHPTAGRSGCQCASPVRRGARGEAHEFLEQGQRVVQAHLGEIGGAGLHRCQ